MMMAMTANSRKNNFKPEKNLYVLDIDASLSWATVQHEVPCIWHRMAEGTGTHFPWGGFACQTRFCYSVGLAQALP